MKKIIFVLSLLLMFSLLQANADVIPYPTSYPLFEYKEYKKITPENIKSLKIIRYTEAGTSEKDVDDSVQINGIYNYLKNIRIADETKYSCTDNTTIYRFKLKDDSVVSIEIECDWIVLKGKNYYIYFPQKTRRGFYK